MSINAFSLWFVIYVCYFWSLCIGSLHAVVSRHVDSDGDLLSDIDEVTLYHTNPQAFDSDKDGTPDGMEIAHKLDPIDAKSRLSRPNIIFILTDDLGYGDLGVLFQNKRTSTKKHATPHLDRLAKEGMILNQHYCPAPVCAPSRASLLSGLHQGHANVRDAQFDKAIEDNYNLGNTLQAAGYYTSLIGKYGLAGKNCKSIDCWPAYPTKIGFDSFYGYVDHRDGHQHYPANRWPLGNNESHREPKPLYHNNNEISSQLDKCYTTDLFTARAKKEIIVHTSATPLQPFFIYLAYDTPHAALQLPTVPYPVGGGINGGLQWLGKSGEMINTAKGKIDSYVHPDYSDKGFTDVEKRFATSVRRIDDAIGDLMQTLKDLKIAENTLIVMSSDNGPHREAYIANEKYTPQSFASYGPFNGIKRDTLEGGIRVPTICWWPGTIAPNQLNNQPSQFHDWLATFTALAQWQKPARVDGVSLKPTLTAKGIQKQGTVYVEYQHRIDTPKYADFSTIHRGQKRQQMQVIFLEGYKGIRRGIESHKDVFEIFNVNTDLKEEMNLAGSSPYFKKLQKRMLNKVVRLRNINSSARRPYDNAIIPAMNTIDVNDLKSGLTFKTFNGIWPWLPDYTTMNEVDSGVVKIINVSQLLQTSNAGMLLTGYINIPTNGNWHFDLTSNSGVHMRIHDIIIADNDYHHSPASQTMDMRLQAGLHPIKLYYRTGHNSKNKLSVKISGPETKLQIIPTEMLFTIK